MKIIEWALKILTIVVLSVLYFGNIDMPILWWCTILVNLVINIFVIIKRKK